MYSASVIKQIMNVQSSGVLGKQTVVQPLSPIFSIHNTSRNFM